MFRPLAPLLAAGLLAAVGPSPAQQPKAKLTLQAVGEQKLEVKRHIHVVGFTPDGKTLAAGEDNLHLFDVTGDPVKKVGEFQTRIFLGIRSLTFSRDSRFAIFGAADNAVRVWDLGSKAETAHAKSHRGDVFSVAVSPDNKLVASGSNDRTAILWNLGADGKLTEQAVLKAEDKLGDSAVRSVSFAKLKSAAVLVTASSNGAVRVYTTAGVPKQVGGAKAKTGLGDSNLVANPAGTLWAFSEREKVHMINTAAAPAGSFGVVGPGHKEAVRDLSFSPDGKLLASAGADGMLFVWDVTTKAARYTKTRPGRFTSVAFSPYHDPVSGDYTLAAGMEDGDVHLIKLGYR